MDWSPSTPSDLPVGVRRLTGSATTADASRFTAIWSESAKPLPDLLLVLASTRTAEQQGISAAGCTPEARRTTALADAELLLTGPSVPPCWSLPPLPAGVSPALISWVVCQQLGLDPQVAALGLPVPPHFPHLRFEDPCAGPSECVSSGCAMQLERVQQLVHRGRRLGRGLRRPLVLAESVPGGTTTALAVLTGLGLPVQALVSGSALHPPMALKQRLVREGLSRLPCRRHLDAQALLAAVGDPFQALSTGILIGVLEADQPVLLAGGSQMAAVLALALHALTADRRQQLCDRVLIGTTAWLAAERLQAATPASSLVTLLSNLEQHYSVSLQAYAAGLRFSSSRHSRLRDFEQGHVKEGVGAGGLALLAQWRGVSVDTLVHSCDRAFDQLLATDDKDTVAP